MKKNHKNYMSTMLIKNILLTTLTSLFGFALIKFPEASYSGIKTGAKFSIEILIPSLFPFMFLSRFVVFSRMLDFLKKPLDKLTKTLFYLPGSSAPIILLSLIGGYPIGAMGTKALLENGEINSEQFNRMMCFAINSGPAFTINAVGYSLLKNPFLGVLLFLIQVFLSLTYAVLLGIIARIKKEPFITNSSNKNIKPIKTSIAIVESTYQTSLATVNMCSLVIVFTLLISLMGKLCIFDSLSYFTHGNFENLKCLMISCLEVTSGCSYATIHGASLGIMSLAIGYGGLCTHLQIISILKDTKFNYLRFHTFRIINSICSFLISILILSTLKSTIPTFISNNSNSFSPNLSSTVIGSISLLILCIYFTISQKNNISK